VLEDLKNGNAAEASREHETAPTPWCRWKDEVMQAAEVG
jgi:hypothetical protein